MNNISAEILVTFNNKNLIFEYNGNDIVMSEKSDLKAWFDKHAPDAVFTLNEGDDFDSLQINFASASTEALFHLQCG